MFESVRRYLQDWSDACEYANECAPDLSFLGNGEPFTALLFIAAVCSLAWAAADNALQIHGGNGFALEYPVSRVLCDARILNIFEGAAEIQAQVIARRLLEG